MLHRWIVDRFEEDFAVLTNDKKETVSVKKTVLPEDASEGNTLWLENGVYIKDNVDTERRQRRIKRKMDRLFKE